MNLRILNKRNFTAALVLSLPIVQTFAQANIAVVATPSTSYVSPWETIDAVNDGFTPSNSNDKSHGAYGNWDNPNSFQWVQYEWDGLFYVDSVDIYWFDDGGGVLTPTMAYIQYEDSGDWATDSIPVPGVKNTFNGANTGSVLTNKIRVVMLNPNQSTGILEFRVWGKTESGSTDLSAPSAPGDPVVSDKTDTSLTVHFSPSTDDVGLKGYEVIMNDSVITNADDTIATIGGLTSNQLYCVTIKAVDLAGNKTQSRGSAWVFTGKAYQTFEWPVYSPTISYNFKDEYPVLEMPTEDLDDCPEVAGSQSSGWWTFKWGPGAKSVVTEAAITPMLERMNKDFAYFRDSLGWPPDKRAKRGYRSAIYLYGSGLCTDNEDSTATGGWQSAINYENESWPMVLLSYYPVYSYDPACPYNDREFQKGAVVHEGIHAVLADLPGCKNAAWFHEGGNTWLQQEADSRRNGDYSTMGFLNGCTFLAPFMPVECYSGWLQDDSFGGPSAEGVNMTNGNGQQLCTWRNYLGGNQYGNSFPTFMGQTLGDGSVAWVWRYATKRVLEGIADGIGESQARRLIMEYRAKQALIDMNEWNGAIKKILDDQFKSTIKEEWTPTWMTPKPWTATPYAKTTFDSATRVLTPEYRTTPGWSGANQIPLNVTGSETGDTIVVEFTPLGPNMTCQLCYRATDGTAVYGIPVSEGMCGIVLEKAPANSAVMVVISNTDYIYHGEETRKAHYDYRLKLVKGILRKASIYLKWYDHKAQITDVIDPVDPIVSVPGYNHQENMDINIYPNPVTGGRVRIDFGNLEGMKIVKLMSVQGQVLYNFTTTSPVHHLPLSNNIIDGMYLLNIDAPGFKRTYKIVVSK